MGNLLGTFSTIQIDIHNKFCQEKTDIRIALNKMLPKNFLKG